MLGVTSKARRISVCLRMVIVHGGRSDHFGDGQSGANRYTASDNAPRSREGD